MKQPILITAEQAAFILNAVAAYGKSPELERAVLMEINAAFPPAEADAEECEACQ